MGIASNCEQESEELLRLVFIQILSVLFRFQYYSKRLELFLRKGALKCPIIIIIQILFRIFSEIQMSIFKIPISCDWNLIDF